MSEATITFMDMGEGRVDVHIEPEASKADPTNHAHVMAYAVFKSLISMEQQANASKIQDSPETVQ